MTIDKLKVDLTSVLQKIKNNAMLSKTDIIKRYGTFDKYLESVLSDSDTALRLLQYDINVPQPLQPVVINGPVQLTINPVYAMPYAG